MELNTKENKFNGDVIHSVIEFSRAEISLIIEALDYLNNCSEYTVEFPTYGQQIKTLLNKIKKIKNKGSKE